MDNKTKETPYVIDATVRESGDDDWDDIECRFSNGEKYAAIQVDIEKPWLASLITRCIIGRPGMVVPPMSPERLKALAAIEPGQIIEMGPPVPQPLFLGICSDRHCDDWYQAFTDPEQAKEWVRGELEKHKEHTSWDFEVTEVPKSVAAFDGGFPPPLLAHLTTYEDGPSGSVEPLKVVTP